MMMKSYSSAVSETTSSNAVSCSVCVAGAATRDGRDAASTTIGNTKLSARWGIIGSFCGLFFLLCIADTILFKAETIESNLFARLLDVGGSELCFWCGFAAFIGFECVRRARKVAPNPRRFSASRNSGDGQSMDKRRASPPVVSRSQRSVRSLTTMSQQIEQTSQRDRTSTAAENVSCGVQELNHAIDLASNDDDGAKASQLLLDFENGGGIPTSITYNLVIRAYARSGDVTGAQKWLARMEAKGVEATICSFNTVLNGCAKSGKAELCETILNRMIEKDGLDANVISYGTVIYAWARRGELDLALGWFHKMTAADIEPDSICYNSLIHACSVRGNSQGAESWMKEMLGRNLDASVMTYTALIDASAKAGDLERAERWMEHMISKGVKPNVVSFSAVIDACAKNCNPSRAEYWHEQMEAAGVQPNMYSYSALINACAKVGDAASAIKWLEIAESTVGTSDVVVYSSVIDACGKAKDSTRAEEVFNRMRAKGIRPHLVSYGALARSFAHTGAWEKVESIAADMISDGFQPNEHFVYAQLLSYAMALPQQRDRAEQCFRDAIGRGINANDHISIALGRAVGRVRSAEILREVCGRALPEHPIQHRYSNNGRTNRIGK